MDLCIESLYVHNYVHDEASLMSMSCISRSPSHVWAQGAAPGQVIVTKETVLVGRPQQSIAAAQEKSA